MSAVIGSSAMYWWHSSTETKHGIEPDGRASPASRISERKYRPYTSVSDLSELRSALMTITLGSLMSFAMSNVDRFAPNIRLNLKLEVMFERRLSTSDREPRGTWVS